MEINDKKSDNEKRIFQIKPLFQKDSTPEGDFEAVRVSQAKVSLYLDLPFFGWLLSQLEVFPTLDSRVKGLTLDSRYIYINTNQMSIKNRSQIRGDLLHQILHLIMKHANTSKLRNEKIFQISSEINTLFMIDETKKKLYGEIYGDLYDKNNEDKFKIQNLKIIPEILQNLTLDAIYKILKEYGLSFYEDKSINDNDIEEDVIKEIQDYAGIEDICGFNETKKLFEQNNSEEILDLEKQRFRGLLKNAMTQVRDKNNLPLDIRKIIDELLEPKLPWDLILERFIQKTIVSDWSWVPPNKRLIGRGLYIPSTERKSINIVVAVDTSGSINKDELTQFATECYSIISSKMKMKMILIDCDMKIQNIRIIEEGNSIDGSNLPWEDRSFFGGGGTSFVPVFEWLEDQDITPEVLIYFTDGMGQYPLDEPNYPVIWVVTEDTNVPFGDMIKY